MSMTEFKFNLTARAGKKTLATWLKVSEEAAKEITTRISTQGFWCDGKNERTFFPAHVITSIVVKPARE